MQHDKPVTYKLVRAKVTTHVENDEYKRDTVTVQTGLTWEQAKAAKKIDRTLTAVREIEAAPVSEK